MTVRLISIHASISCKAWKTFVCWASCFGWLSALAELVVLLLDAFACVSFAFCWDRFWNLHASVGAPSFRQVSMCPNAYWFSIAQISISVTRLYVDLNQVGMLFPLTYLRSGSVFLQLFIFLSTSVTHQLYRNCRCINLYSSIFINEHMVMFST